MLPGDCDSLALILKLLKNSLEKFLWEFHKKFLDEFSYFFLISSKILQRVPSDLFKGVPLRDCLETPSECFQKFLIDCFYWEFKKKMAEGVFQQFILEFIRFFFSDFFSGIQGSPKDFFTFIMFPSVVFFSPGENSQSFGKLWGDTLDWIGLILILNSLGMSFCKNF